MKVIVAVLKDLYMFAFKYRFGLLFPSPSTMETGPFSEVVVNKSPVSLEYSAAPISPEDTEPSLLSKNESEDSFQSVGYIYLHEAFLYALPTKTFDGVVERLSYGESFQILNSQGKWLNVLYGDLKGWIHMDDVTRSNADLNPKFVIGETYAEDNPSTIKLRTRIDDEFHTAQFALQLQNVEYVTYKLFRKGNSIKWPHERPRMAGTWQRLLKGISGVHMGVTPKTGSVMEYVHTDNTGHVAYVESVYPDSAITISEVGYPSEGIYSERTLSKDEWIELRPVFIEVI